MRLATTLRNRSKKKKADLASNADASLPNVEASKCTKENVGIPTTAHQEKAGESNSSASKTPAHLDSLTMSLASGVDLTALSGESIAHPDDLAEVQNLIWTRFSDALSEYCDVSFSQKSSRCEAGRQALDVRLSQCLERIDVLEKQLRAERMARKLLERRILENEGKFLQQLASCEALNRDLESRLKEEERERRGVREATARRLNALEAMLVVPSCTTSSTKNLGSTHIQPMRSRMNFQSRDDT